MKVAVTAAGPRMDDRVDSRFGRCRWFVVVETSTLDFEPVENTGVNSASGAGVASARLLADRGVETVLTGKCGPKALATLQAAGIEVFTGADGTVRETVAKLAAGELVVW